MSIERYFKLIQTLDFYIRRKATGTPEQLGKKIGFSRRSVLRLLKELKNLGVPIKFSKNRKSYFYSKDGNIVKKLFETHESLTKEEMKKINGGNFINLCYKNGVPIFCTEVI